MEDWICVVFLDGDCLVYSGTKARIVNGMLGQM
jgi:hypothetical protein